mgnify:CR=1 FL=1
MNQKEVKEIIDESKKDIKDAIARAEAAIRRIDQRREENEHCAMDRDNRNIFVGKVSGLRFALDLLN